MPQLLVIVALPPSAASDAGPAFARAAALTGLAPAEVRRRLAGALPRPLLLDGDDDHAREAAEGLEAGGFRVVACDPRAVPGDDERLVARSLELGPGPRLTVADGLGDREEIDPASLILIQEGARVVTRTETVKRSERRFDAGRALLSGGLILTKKVEKEETRSTTSEDRFVVLHRSDGGRDVMLYERRLDYRGLGGDQGPSSRANHQLLVQRLRALAPAAPYDDRVLRAGLVASLAAVPADAVDLALMLVLLIHLRWPGAGSTVARGPI